MAQDIVSSLFGLSPWEVQQQRNTAIDQAAQTYAKQDPFQRATATMYQAGAGLGRIGAGMLGMQDPAVAEAEQRQAALSGVDPSSPESLLQAAQRVSDPQMRMRLTLTAREMQAKLQEQAREKAKVDLAERKQTFQETEGMEWKKEQARLVLEQKAEAARLRSEDTRLGIEQRREAAREAAATRAMIAQIAASNRSIEKPMTAAQQDKYRKEFSAATSAFTSLSDEFKSAVDKATVLKEHPGLAGATGIRGAFPSMPGSDSATAENLLDEFKGTIKKVGLEYARAGGSIGQITEKEWDIVESMVAKIDPVKLGKEGTKSQIDKVIGSMERMVENKKREFETRFSDVPSTPSAPPTIPPATAPSFGAPPPGAVRKKGG